jgi:hypothetical protein
MQSSHTKIFKQMLLYEFSQMVAEIGGSWGLFLGVSIIGIYELVVSVISDAFISFSRIVR